MDENRSNRLQVEITEDQRAIIGKLPYGCKKALFAPIVEELCDLLKEYNESAVILFVNGDITLEDLSKIRRSKK